LRSFLSVGVEPEARAAELSEELRREERLIHQLQKTDHLKIALLRLESEQSVEARSEQNLQRELLTLLGEQAPLEEEERERREALLEMEQRCRDLELILSLSKQREQLQEGEPCPLCGGLEHPLLRSNEREEEERKQRLLALRQEQHQEGKRQKLLELQLRNLSQTQAQLKGQLNAHKALARRSKERLRLAQESLKQALEAVGLAHNAQLEEIQARSIAAQERLNQAQRELEALEQGLKERRGLELELKWGQAEQAALKEQGHKGELELSAARARLGACQESRLRDQEELKRGQEMFQQRLAELGLRAQRAEALLEAQAKVSLLKLEESAHQRAQAQLQQAEQRLVEQRQERLSLERRRGELEEALEECRLRAKRVREQLERGLSGDLEVLEAQLQANCQRARRQREEREEQLSAERELELRVQAQQESLLFQLEKLEPAQEKRERELRGLLEALKIFDEELLLAQRLSPQTREHLKEEKQRLYDERTAARARKEQAQEALERCLLEAPIQDDRYSLEDLATMIAAEEESLESLGERLLILRSQLKQQEEGRQAHEALLIEHSEAQQEFEQRDRLHSLIGVRDGDRFKRFAQVLNLQELIAKANRHLERLEPRYSLRPDRDDEGELRLNFVISDGHQAGAERPISTLSGGEFFLVSLALALSLADFRTLRMPMETLLLDEGFGTLDAETLNIAMQALEALQGEGTQVGIISHVEALKERIDARIIVEKLGAGRSHLYVDV